MEGEQGWGLECDRASGVRRPWGADCSTPSKRWRVDGEFREFGEYFPPTQKHKQETSRTFLISRVNLEFSRPTLFPSRSCFRKFTVHRTQRLIPSFTCWRVLVVKKAKDADHPNKPGNTEEFQQFQARDCSRPDTLIPETQGTRLPPSALRRQRRRPTPTHDWQVCGGGGGPASEASGEALIGRDQCMSDGHLFRKVGELLTGRYGWMVVNFTPGRTEGHVQ